MLDAPAVPHPEERDTPGPTAAAPPMTLSMETALLGLVYARGDQATLGTFLELTAALQAAEQACGVQFVPGPVMRSVGSGRDASEPPALGPRDWPALGQALAWGQDRGVLLRMRLPWQTAPWAREEAERQLRTRLTGPAGQAALRAVVRFWRAYFRPASAEHP